MQLSPPPSQVNMSRGHFNPPSHRVEKVGSTLPEHPRFSPGTHKARNYQKDVRIALQAICSMKIAGFINISILVM